MSTMSVFETMYAESLYRDLVRLSTTVDNVDQTRIMARMVDTVYEAVRDHGRSVALVAQIKKLDVDLDPQDLVNSIHSIIKVHFIPDVVAS